MADNFDEQNYLDNLNKGVLEAPDQMTNYEQMY